MTRPTRTAAWSDWGRCRSIGRQGQLSIDAISTLAFRLSRISTRKMGYQLFECQISQVAASTFKLPFAFQNTKFLLRLSLELGTCQQRSIRELR